MTRGAEVSVVITFYDQAAYIREAIESVVVQSDPPGEIVVVDDGSPQPIPPDALREGVRYLRQPNRGVAAARNAGAKATSGRYLVFLDGDDRLLPQALRTHLAYLEQRAEHALVYGRVTLIGGDGSLLPAREDPRPTGDHYRFWLRRNDIWSPGQVMYARAAFDSVGGFAPFARNSCDHELHLRMAREFPVGWHGHPVLEHRLHGSNTSGDAVEMLMSTIVIYAAQRRHVLGDREREAAYRAGLWGSTRHYAALALRQALADARGGEWRRAARALRVLGGSCPRALLPEAAATARAILQRRRRARAA